MTLVSIIDAGSRGLFGFSQKLGGVLLRLGGEPPKVALYNLLRYYGIVDVLPLADQEKD